MFWRGSVLVWDKVEREGAFLYYFRSLSKVFLGKFHEFGGVWWSVVRGVVVFVKYDVACTLELAGCGVFKPNVSAGGLEAMEDTGGGVGGV